MGSIDPGPRLGRKAATQRPPDAAGRGCRHPGRGSAARGSRWRI